MSHTSRTKLVKIGNSRGIRIPKAVLERLHLADEIDIVVKDDHLEVRPGRNPRDGWADAFSEMAKRGDDKPIDEPTPTAWEGQEWNW